ncbi:hypothetical protein ACQP2X_02505 [Actinoplanes sp. CA-131856]
MVKHRETLRVAIGSSGGLPIAVTSSHERHPQFFWLDDLAEAVRLPHADSDVIVAYGQQVARFRPPAS